MIRIVHYWERLSFYVQFFLTLLISCCIGAGLIYLLTCVNLFHIKLPRLLVLMLSALPFLFFLWNSIFSRVIFKPLKFIRISAVGLVMLLIGLPAYFWERASLTGRKQSL